MNPHAFHDWNSVQIRDCCPIVDATGQTITRQWNMNFRCWCHPQGGPPMLKILRLTATVMILLGTAIVLETTSAYAQSAPVIPEPTPGIVSPHPTIRKPIAGLPVPALSIPDTNQPITVVVRSVLGNSVEPTLRSKDIPVITQPVSSQPVHTDRPKPLDTPSVRNEVSQVEANGWITVFYDGFEEVWPDSYWITWDADRLDYGEIFWDDTDYQAYTGDWSLGAGNGGRSAQSPSFGYPDNVDTWVTYGPFDLSGASAAELSFMLWASTEQGYDQLFYGVSRDGNQFYGETFEGGATTGWESRSLDLAALGGLGDPLGEQRVWIGFDFWSDGSTTGQGVFLDDVTISKYVDCPEAKVTYYSGVKPWTTYVAQTCESWDAISRDWAVDGPNYNGMVDNEFSVEYEGDLFLPAGVFTFWANVDDNVRVQIDNKLLINEWGPSTGVESRRTVYFPTEGLHQVKVDYAEYSGHAFLHFGWQQETFLAP